VRGYRKLEVGQLVELEWQEPGQDGCRYRAVRVWPVGQEPHDIPVGHVAAAYSSTLTIAYDDTEMTTKPEQSI
jgi:hypothetical protein